MEWLQGETMAQRIRRDGPLDAQSAAAIVNQLLDALEAAHRRGIIHRDFKTANVMLTEGGEKAVVMDFGLAREIKAGNDLRTTIATGTFAGTPAYMAPEQLRGQGSSVATDIHALGVVLFEICAGRLPFVGSGPLEIAAQRLRDDPPLPQRFAPGLDSRWAYTILRCLESEPGMRPPTVQAVRESLGNAPPFFRWHRRKFIAAGLAASLLSAGGALVSWGGWAYR
jgi:serine/threonine-protein kinase